MCAILGDADDVRTRAVKIIAVVPHVEGILPRQFLPLCRMRRIVKEDALPQGKRGKAWKHLALVHHDPRHTDRIVDKGMARAQFRALTPLQLIFADIFLRITKGKIRLIPSPPKTDTAPHHNIIRRRRNLAREKVAPDLRIVLPPIRREIGIEKIPDKDRCRHGSDHTE